MFLFILKLFAVILLAVFIFGIFSTLIINNLPTQKRFVAGTFPTIAPDGIYEGTVFGQSTAWKGKKFSAAGNSGINIFAGSKGGEVEKYPFKTYKGAGVHDKTLQVFKIDYSVAENPFWLWPILDEMVEIAPGKFLGKLQVRIIPGYPFTLAFFELQKPTPNLPTS